MLQTTFAVNLNDKDRWRVPPEWEWDNKKGLFRKCPKEFPHWAKDGKMCFGLIPPMPYVSMS